MTFRRPALHPLILSPLGLLLASFLVLLPLSVRGAEEKSGDQAPIPSESSAPTQAAEEPVGEIRAPSELEAAEGERASPASNLEEEWKPRSKRVRQLVFIHEDDVRRQELEFVRLQERVETLQEQLEIAQGRVQQLEIAQASLLADTEERLKAMESELRIRREKKDIESIIGTPGGVGIGKGRDGEAGTPPPAGSLVFYHFWATHCGPCMTELPEVIAFARTLPRDRVSVVFVAEEYLGNEAKAKRMFQEMGGSGGLTIVADTDRGPRRAVQVSTNEQPVSVLATRNKQARITRVGKMRRGDYARFRRCVDQPLSEVQCR